MENNSKPMSKQENKNITSISSLVSESVYRNKSKTYEVVYRAPTKKINKITKEKPSLFKNNAWMENEDLIYKEFIASAPHEFENMTTFDNLTKMRHYLVPNRLLDVTYDPLMALFFSCGDEGKGGSNQIIFYKVKQENIKYSDSDTVTVLAALSKLKYKEKENLRKIVNIIKQNRKIEVMTSKLEKIFGSNNNDEKASSKNELFNKYVDKYIPQLDWEIRKEQPSWYKGLLDIKTFTECYLVKPKMNNPRIIAQSGAFFVFPFKDTSIDTALTTSPSYVKEVKKTKKIIKDLECLNITITKYMPELDKYAIQIKNDIKNKKTSKKSK